jgi:hypothetical protein
VLTAQIFETNQKKELEEYFQINEIDYALFSKTWGGVYKNSNELFLSTDWRIYNPDGDEVVFIFTRSVDKKNSPSTLTPSTMTEKLLELFSENLNKFSEVISNPTDEMKKEIKNAKRRSRNRRPVKVQY